MQSSKQDTANTLRSVLLSSQKAIQLDKLQNEYKLLIGAPIPFRELGFKNLEAYLKSIPDVVKLHKNPNGEYVCSPVANSPTAHIAKMVHNQKSSKNTSSSDGPALPELEVIPCSTKTMKHPHHMAEKTTTLKLQLPLSQRQQGQLVQKPQQKVHQPTKLVPTPNKAALTNFVARNHLGKISYQTKEMKSKKAICFFSVVKIDKKTFMSYPNEKPTKLESEEEAARCALEDLKAQFEGGNPNELQISSVGCFPRRVFDLVTDKKNGVWADYINSTYVETFRERLPMNWIAIVESDPKFKVERINETKAIIYPNIHQNDYSVVRRFSDASDASISDTSDTSTPSHASPAPLVLPLSNDWYVYITQVNSASDVCMRLIGDEYSEKYHNLATDMELHYMGIPLTMTTSLSVGNLYAAKVDEGWHRVEVLEILSNDTVRCSFVDHGDVDDIKTSVILPLEFQFRSLPFQAVKCRLTGLEGINVSIFNMNLVKLIVAKSFYAYVDSREGDAVSVTLYDTSSDVDKNMNKLLMEMTLEDMQAPSLNTVITEVYLSHIASTCEIFLQIQSFNFKLLEKYIQYAMMKCSFQNIKVVEPSKMYLVKYSSDGMYYRAVVDKESAKKDAIVSMFFVDYGNSEATSLNSILEIPNDCECLRKIPYQALKCSLYDVPKSPECFSKAAERLKSLVPENVPLLVKLISKSGSMPLVELFKRLPDTNELVSVNQTLIHEVFLAKKNNEDKSFINKTKNQELNKENASATTNSVKLPPVGEYCDIHITWAANPFNFMFQLWVGGEVFDKLMIDMQQFYTSKNEVVQIPGEQVKDGELYAVFYEGIWYRAKATVKEEIMRHKVVPVYFIDFGDHSLVPLDCVCHLVELFRILPSQALRGQLADIIPANGDWEAEDCMRFKELVEDKELVALVKNHTKNADGDDIVVVELIDTTVPDKDVYVHEILVDEKRAHLKSNAH